MGSPQVLVRPVEFVSYGGQPFSAALQEDVILGLGRMGWEGGASSETQVAA